jgi:hypothetical protein
MSEFKEPDMDAADPALAAAWVDSRCGRLIPAMIPARISRVIKLLINDGWGFGQFLLVICMVIFYH